MSRTPPDDVEAMMSFLPTELGGKTLPARTGYRSQFRYAGENWDAIHRYPDVDEAKPGDTVRTLFAFVNPRAHVGKLHVGTPFVILEGARVVAYGSITKLLQLEESAKHDAEGHAI